MYVLWSVCVQDVSSDGELPPSMLTLFSHLLAQVYIDHHTCIYSHVLCVYTLYIYIQGSLDDSGFLKIFSYLQKVLLAHRIQPLSGIGPYIVLLQFLYVYIYIH